MHAFSIEANEILNREIKVWLYKWVIIFDPENCSLNFGLSFFWCKGTGYTVFFCTALSINKWNFYSELLFLFLYVWKVLINHYEKLSVVHNVGNRWSVKSSIYCSLAFLSGKLHIRETNGSLNGNAVLMLIYPFIFTPIFYGFPCSCD